MHHVVIKSLQDQMFCLGRNSCAFSELLFLHYISGFMKPFECMKYATSVQTVGFYMSNFYC